MNVSFENVQTEDLNRDIFIQMHSVLIVACLLLYVVLVKWYVSLYTTRKKTCNISTLTLVFDKTNVNKRAVT